MSLEDLEKKNRDELYQYILDNFGEPEKILAFIVTLLDSGSFYARQTIEGMGEKAYDKWNDGTNYEESIAQADVRIVDNMKKELFELIGAGIAVGEAAEYLSERYYATRIHDLSRIMVTEHTRIEAAEVIERGDRYIYHCVHDERTCPECLMRDGMVFLSSEANFGVNLPPMHPWCRCWVTNG